MYVCSEELFVEWVIKNEVDLVVEGLSDMNYDEFMVKVIFLDGEFVLCVVIKGIDDWVYVKFMFYKVGFYKVKIFYMFWINIVNC